LNPRNTSDSNGGGGDPDGDQLSNLQEHQMGYSPSSADSNGNGLQDGFEDFDGDLAANLVERAFGTDLLVFDNWKDDSDLDGLPDGYEHARLLNPTSSEPAPTLPAVLDKCPAP
jgi:hypothetical protein